LRQRKKGNYLLPQEKSAEPQGVDLSAVRELESLRDGGKGGKSTEKKSKFEGGERTPRKRKGNNSCFEETASDRVKKKTPVKGVPIKKKSPGGGKTEGGAL